MADGKIALEIEQVKAAYFAERAQAMIERGQELKVGRFGHATALLWPGFNRVYALSADDLPRLPDLLAWYREEEESPIFEIAPTPGSDRVEQDLRTRGFAPDGEQAVFYGPAEEREAKIPVRWIGPEERADWAALYIKAYEWDVAPDDPLRDELVDQYAGPDWHLCVAEIDGRPVAMGALYTGKPIAYFANAGTLPDYRGRGCQAAVLAKRCSFAAAKGHTHIAADATPGGGSRRNLERAGFPLYYTKTRWKKS